MQRGLVMRFGIGWLVSSLGLWIAAGFINNGIDYQSRLTVVIIAGFLLAIVNGVLRPILVILSLPAITFTLGLFMIVINGLMVLLVSRLYPALEINGFGTAMLVGLIIGFVNYLVNIIINE